MSWIRSIGARVFIAGMAAAGLAVFVMAFAHWQTSDPVKFACYLIAALLASSLKMGLPGIEGTLSVNFLFTLLGILELSLPQTLALGLASVLAQFYWKPARRVKSIQLIFNLSQVAVSTALAYGAYWLVSERVLHTPGPLALLAAAMTHFACNTAATATVIGLTENKPIGKVWGDSHRWLLPYYMVGAAAAGLVHFLNSRIGWQSSLLVLPPIYLMYRSYRLYLSKLDAEKQHAEQVSSIHLRTIEALALAIEAKDETTGEHLQRVRVYAMELGRELQLTEDEMEALQAASVLHDIGKLAVPEAIISKPGRLTPEEFDKMKIHPVVGAEILEQVHFPYPVVPIVRAHHEKWDGSGYPYGLSGESIPIGARILSAVDCLDALASDRQYRKALPLDEAMAKVVADSGKAFDPKVVKILARRYIELEKLAHAQPPQPVPKLSTDIKIERGAAPDAGFVQTTETAPACEARAGAESPVALAREHGREIAEFCRQNAANVSAADICALIAVRMKKLVPHDALAVYVPREGALAAEFAAGDNYRAFSSLTIPLGEGLAGWVAQNHKAIVNGNPSVEPGYASESAQSPLHSALAAPVEGPAGIAAVLALYRADQDAFTKDDLQVVEALCREIGGAFEETKPKTLAASAK
jgi:putative nucleotidyltransferase with HDIG domain